MKLRLYHHPDGARIAYREAGTGPPLALLHSKGLTHREFEPVVDALAHRHRVVLPDLPLHGASEDRPTHPYSPEWLDELLTGFIADTCGPRPIVAGHGLGALLALRAVARGSLQPSKLVLLPNPMHTKPPRSGMEKAGSVAVRLAVVPGCDRILARAGALMLRPSRGDRLTVTDDPGARDLVRHALMDLAGNGNRVRSWGKAARRWPRGPQKDLVDAYGRMDFPVLLLWADEDAVHPLAIAEEALDLFPDAVLRVLPRTGFLIAYDDPVGVARELVAFSRVKESLPFREMYELERPPACSIGRAMEILGERWTFLILRESFYGVRRFSDIQRNLGIARNILSTRLQSLVAAGILDRVLYQEEPARYDYRLSESGKDLYPAIVALMRWGDRHLLKDEHGPPVVLHHNACGHDADPLLVCSHCHEELNPLEVTPVRGEDFSAA